jgi:MFS family permease
MAEKYVNMTQEGAERIAPASMKGESRRGDEAGGKKYGRNFILAFLNGVFFTAVAPLVDEHTTIPLFIRTLTENKIFVGLAVGIRQAGWYIPQLFVANYVSAKPRKMPTYIFWGFFRGFGILGIALSILVFGGYDKSVLLCMFLLFWSMYQLSGGMAGVSFMDVVGKTVSRERFGKLWGYRFFVGGLMALGSVAALKFILDEYDFPLNYEIIFFLAFIIVAFAVISFCLAKEDPDASVRPPKKLKELFAECAAILKNDRRFRLLLILNGVFMFWANASPFFSVFAKEHKLMGEDFSGFTLAKMLGIISAYFVWGKMQDSEKFGRHYGIFSVVCVVAFAMPGCVLLSAVPALADASQIILLGVYFAIGSISSGFFIASSSALLFIAPENNRPIYIGLMNTILGPVILFLALASGTIVELLSYEIVFGGATAAAGFSFYLAVKMKRMEM